MTRSGENLRMVMVTKAKFMAFAVFLIFGLFNAASGPLGMKAFAQSDDPSFAQSDDRSFDCLSQPGPTEVITGFFSDKFQPTAAPNKKFDARNASFQIPETISHSMISLDGSGDNSGMCWAGGYITASLSWHGLDVSWDQSKHGPDGDGGKMNNTTSATSYEDRMTWTGLHVYNVHDGIRTSSSYNNWTVQHVWFDYIRDDCVENDHIYSGTVYDSLLDGCYTGISVRPSSSGKGEGETITMDKVLLRMEPMPYPYKWETKDDPVLIVPGYGDMPFRYGNVFKMDKGNEPNFKITNSVFLLEYNSKKVIFPPKQEVSVCSNNTIIWLGDPADAPSYLLNDFPGCFTIITDKTEGKNFWKSKVADWHARHSQVGAQRKPANPGEYSWPRFPALNVPNAQKPTGPQVDDTEAPTVIILTPDGVDPVWGTVTVTANVADNVGVVGVQFKLDGVDVGVEDPTAPYTVNWDSTEVTDGAYKLTAVARDAAGNRAESDPVSVTVDNTISSTLTVVAAEDASINPASPTTNYGSLTTLLMDNRPVKQFLIKFSVMGIGTREVTSARLRLYCVNGSDSGGDFYEVTDNSWSEATVTWDTAPRANFPAIASLGPAIKKTWVEVNVTEFITGDGIYSMLVSTLSNNGADYSSKEIVGYEPQLVLSIR